MKHGKYYDYASHDQQADSISAAVLENEHVFWHEKPRKSAFILNKILPMMPFALAWLAFDSMFISAFFGGADGKGGFLQALKNMPDAVREGGGFLGNMQWFLIGFFALHLFPVWLWLWNVFTALARWKNSEYAITDKRILIRNGLVGSEVQSIFYTDINSLDMRIGVIVRMLNVGDIKIYSSGKNTSWILDISKVHTVYKNLQKTVMDIQADIHYPNDMRPAENKGYNTQYRP